jgi:ligand-binding sensor domain-containing protein
VINPIKTKTIYIGTTTGVFISMNAGENWEVLGEGLANTDVRVLAIDTKTPNILYAGTSDNGVFVLK